MEQETKKNTKIDDYLFYMFMGTMILGFLTGIIYLVISYFS